MDVNDDMLWFVPAFGRRLRHGMVALLALPFLYLLSYGPACSLMARSALSADQFPSWFRAIPKPLRNAYLRQWIILDPYVRDVFANGTHY